MANEVTNFEEIIMDYKDQETFCLCCGLPLPRVITISLYLTVFSRLGVNSKSVVILPPSRALDQDTRCTST